MTKQELIIAMIPLAPALFGTLALFRWVRDRHKIWFTVNAITGLMSLIPIVVYTLRQDHLFAMLWGGLLCLYISNGIKIWNLVKAERELKALRERLPEDQRKSFDEYIRMTPTQRQQWKRKLLSDIEEICKEKSGPSTPD